MSNDRSGSKLIWNTMMSLDGFVADRAESMEWAFDFDAGSAASTSRLVDRIGALIVGRRTMDVEDRNQPGFYGGAFTGPFFVLTSDRERPAPVVRGVTGSVLHDPIDGAVREAVAAAGGRDVAVLGRSVARACLAADLLDEIVVFVAPVLLGGGVRLYEGTEHRLDLVAAERDGELTTLTLAPRRP